MLIFDDTTPDTEHAAPNGYGTGFTGRAPEGYGATADGEFPFPIIDEAQWQSIIQEREANGRQLSQRMVTAGLPCKDQQSTNFCWANAPTHTVEMEIVKANQPMIILSPASVACPINGFRNQGGWGKDALDQLRSGGAVPVDKWPANAIDRQYFTAANKTLALQYRAEKWCELQPRNLPQLVTSLLNDVEVAVAFNWWGHEVTAYDAVWVNGAIGIRCRNSWGMSYGDKGFFVLQGSKMLPDDAVAPLTVTPS